MPTRQGRNDRIIKDENKNLVICPLLHDGDFMQAFYEAWRIVQAFLAADARMPAEVSLPNPAHREVTRILEERREFPVRDVIEAIRPFGQPELLQTNARQVELQTIKGETQTDMAVAPLPRQLELPF